VGNTLSQREFSSSSSQLRVFNCHHNNKRSLKLEKDKACCCNERCESVETLRSVAQSTSYSGESKVAVCDIHGKLEPPRPLRWKSHDFLHVHQQNIRSLSRVSPQPVTEEIFAILRSPNESIFILKRGFQAFCVQQQLESAIL
jgi:hypothetical protein